MYFEKNDFKIQQAEFSVKRISCREPIMKTIGLIGGMSWESSIEYYRIINERAKTILGGLHSAKSIMFSVDFAEIEALQLEGRWDEAARVLVSAAGSLEMAGADFVVLCTNTMHKLADDIERGITIPFLHIADATARAIEERNLKSVGLLGTRFTMEEDFYRGRLEKSFGLKVIVPGDAARDILHHVIYDELCVGLVKADSRMQFRGIMEGLVDAGAEGIILGCTEMGLLVKEGDCRVPLFDTARIHAEAAVDYAIFQGGESGEKEGRRTRRRKTGAA